MLDQIPDELKSSTEKAESFVDWLAENYYRKKWSTILVLIAIALIFFFNQPAVQFVLDRFPAKPKLPEGYWLFHGLAVAGIFIAAFIIAVRTKRRQTKAQPADFAERRAIKGLRPFGFDDAEIFARLQREDSLRECLEAITDRDFRFGVLCGESGCGKTSFLQAGLWPRLLMQKTPHRCVYVKFSDLDPLDSLRQAFAEQMQLPKDKIAPADFLTLLEAALAADPKPLVLLFDQFEQFFVQRKTKEARKSFVQALAAWYHAKPPLPVKILLCIRGDYSDRLIELQKEMVYSLGVHNNFRLEKFTPKEAAEVFRVIAETEGLSFDESFVRELTEHELASRDDGKISPVDLQILAWMIRGQASGMERAFNRVTYQKLGGIEGLLEKFLSLALGARETEARRQAALKVLLGLTDLEHDVRAGVLTVSDVQQKLGDTVAESEVRDALEWLGRGDIRLITPSQRNGALGYELAHERLIPALRRLAGKELSEADQANELLDRRVNEWEGNKRDRRYLLRWRELRQIKQQQPYLIWGKQEIQKRELLKQSRRRAYRQAGFGALGIILLTALSLGWFMLEKTQAQREKAKQRRDFANLLQRTDLEARERVKQVHDFTRKHGDPRPEVTTLDSTQFCYVPPGQFWMGDSSDSYASLHLNDSLNYGYWISRFPITVAQFEIFVHDSTAKMRSPTEVEYPSNCPVVNVSWYDAHRFCKWLTLKWHNEGWLPGNWQVRLPSEAEWEKAARGGVEIPATPHIHSIASVALESTPQIALQANPLPQRRYPWGDSFNANFANSYESNIGSTSAVGCFPHGQSPYGCEEMSGNVWQWTRSLFREYPYDPHDGREDFDAKSTGRRALRGGSWYDNVDVLRCAARRNVPPVDRNVIVGFRVVVAQS